MERSEDRTFWRSLEEPPENSRRDFLKAAGFTLAGAVLGGCSRAPVERAIPYLKNPEDVTPGLASYYASTCGGCSAGCGILVKNRDGRPIKLEANPDHPFSARGLCAVGQASVLGVYDSLRLRQPLVGGSRSTWKDVDAEVMAKLDTLRRDGGAIRYLSTTIVSPAKRARIAAFLAGFRDARHVTYDSLSASAILDAHLRTHSVRALPRYHFDRATVIVSFDADFLGTWISPVEYTIAYSAGRRLNAPEPTLSYHVQLESRLSLTGSNADRRVRLAPQDLPGLLDTLASRLATLSSGTVAAPASPGPYEELVDDLANRLWQARGQSLVVCGSQDVEAQVQCNVINDRIGSYGTTIDIERPSYQRQGSDPELARLLAEIAVGSVHALLIDGVNPVFELPGGDLLARKLGAIPLVVNFAQRPDETSAAAGYSCPDHHFLESWGDAEAVSGIVSLIQPAILPMGDTRAVVETLSAWMGEPKPADVQIRDHWEQQIYPRRPWPAVSFQSFWDTALQSGFASVEPVLTTAKAIAVVHRPGSAGPVSLAVGRFTLVLYPKSGILDGRHSYNPWLQELPDPISKVTWDNYASLSPAAAAALGVTGGDVVRMDTAGPEPAHSVELPVVVQPGQDDRVVAVALGYGSVLSERFAGTGPRWLQARPTVGADGRVGKNVAAFLKWAAGSLQYDSTVVRLTPTGARRELASTQTHHTLTVPAHLTPASGEVRPIIQETTLDALRADPRAGAKGPEAGPEALWPADHEYTGHRWAMTIDLTACTGCSACVIACQAENNVPVVGQDEVRRNREMHWLRIDRYYSGDGADVDVAHQPMLCQHCGNAPCETVCPVLATTHSEEGLNQQVYNRCVGTRYCANNCPYKVRRFNWFDYPHDDLLANMVLNPDVTVRSRGVMEKCSFCVQRIHEARAEAVQQGRPLRDGDVQTACQQTCPAQAIQFGDANDPNSNVSKLALSGRHYRVLEEINVRPSIGYLRIVRNRPDNSERGRRG